MEEDDRPQVTLDVDFGKEWAYPSDASGEDTVYDWKFVGLSHNTVRGAV